MEEMRISVVVSQGNNVLTNWKKGHEESLPSLLSAVKCVKQYINDYLSELILKQKSLCSNAEGSTEPTVNFAEEDAFEGLFGEADSISGFIRHIEIINEQHLLEKKKDEKKMVDDLKEVKKRKL